MSTKGDTVTFTPPGDDPARRTVRASAIPISVDYKELTALARTPAVLARAAEIRASLGDPEILLLGVDRLDYTKGIRHRLKAYEELLQDKAIAPPDVTLMQVSTPSRERVDAYRHLREEIERTVGSINGEYSDIGSPAVYYLYQTYPKSEMAAMFLAADVMIVTPLRDGMNLVAKEYVASRHDLGGALVLSEFTGAWDELHQAFICNPHDVEGVKQTIMRAITAPQDERRRRMKALRQRVADHDVQRWASLFLESLASALAEPHRPTRASDEEMRGAERANRSNLRTSDNASEQNGEQ
jgi:trehalose 6-phosphate synthase